MPPELDCVEEGKTTSRWSESTVAHAVRGLMSALRDFGVLQGAVNKNIARLIPIEAFAYIAFYLKHHEPSGAKLIELPEWNLFFMRREPLALGYDHRRLAVRRQCG